MSKPTDLSRRSFLGLSAASVGTAMACSELQDTVQIQKERVVEPSRSIPILAETEVLVLGGGPAGLSAALAAAREGVDTLLVERYGCFGGVITQSIMGSIAWYRHVETVDSGGISVEFEQRAKQIGGSVDIWGRVDNQAVKAFIELMGLMKDGKPTYEILDPEMFKCVADQLVQEAGIVPLLHCWATDAIMEGDVIRGVVVQSKSGRQAILARRVIDATGDADIAARAGAPYEMSPKDRLMEVTVNFGCSGIDVDSFAMHLLQNPGKMSDWATHTSGKEDDMLSTHLTEPFEKAKAAGEIPEDMDLICFPGYYTDTGELPGLNAVHLFNIDGTDVRDLTEAEMEGRRRVLMAVEALKKYTPGFEKARLRTIASSVGIRETRKIVGEYSITEQDVKNQARFADSIGICPEFLDGYGVLYLPTTGRYFQVPYGIMLPRQVENLLVAGRCVAGDRISHAATRQMVCCSVTGQGAGVAAAVSLKDAVTCREVDPGRVQRRLEAQGVRIG